MVGLTIDAVIPRCAEDRSTFGFERKKRPRSFGTMADIENFTVVVPGERTPFAGATVHMRQREALLRVLVRMRGAAALNQTGLGARLGMTQSEVSKFERGERCLDVLRLGAWLRCLNMSFGLFTEALEREIDRLDGLAD